MTRVEFKRAVFARDSDRCVICGEAAVDAHHILDRSLFEDGGYVLDNGVSLCAACHWKAERSELACEELRAAAGISTVILPEGLEIGKMYDKWGKDLEDQT